MRIHAAALAVSLLVMPACVASQSIGRTEEIPTPATPAAVKDILVARPFTLQTPYRNHWTKERAMVSTGLLVVLEVDPDLVIPRNALEPVLYAGDVTVQRLNHGHRSGRVIGIIPGAVDLASTPIWFGTPELPERVTASSIRAERARAEQAGIRPLRADRIGAVMQPAVTATDLAALLRNVAAELVYEYSPQDREIADTWRLPIASGKRPN
jgi:hypothetical protein